MTERETRLAFMSQDFDKLEVGQTYTFTRTFTEGDVTAFCGVTGDFNPYHTDAEFCAQTVVQRPVVPGLLTGSMITHIGGMMGVLAAQMTFEFLAPVYIGDTIACCVRIDSKDENKRRVGVSVDLTNQDGTSVLRAAFQGLPGRVRLRPDARQS